MGAYFFKHASRSQSIFEVKRKLLGGSQVILLLFQLQDHKERVNAFCHFGKYLETLNIGRVS